MLAAAATQAAVLTDLPLAERLARAARDAGAGFDMQLMLAFTLSWMFRAEEAEQEFAGATALATTDAQRLRVVLARWANLYGVLARLDEAQALLSNAEASLGPVVDLLGIRAFSAAACGRLGEAEHTARQVLGSPVASTQAQTYAAWMLTAVLGLTGRDDQAADVAARAQALAVAAPDTAPLQINIGF